VAALTILTYGEECLRKPAAPVGEVTDEVRRLIRNMGETMYATKGVGLAATQVGVNARVFVCDTDYVREDGGSPGLRRLKAFINPEITSESQEDAPFNEGCLSVPGIEGEVYRSTSVTIRYLDEDGVGRERLLQGLEARCAQHELDHINGVLFVDRLPPLKRRLLAGKLNSLKREHLEAAGSGAPLSEAAAQHGTAASPVPAPPGWVVAPGSAAK